MLPADVSAVCAHAAAVYVLKFLLNIFLDDSIYIVNMYIDNSLFCAAGMRISVGVHGRMFPGGFRRQSVQNTGIFRGKNEEA